MSKGIIETVAGGLALAAGILIDIGTFGAATPLLVAIAGMLIGAGAGMVMSGIGTMIAGTGSQTGFLASATRNPIAPWEVGYGRCRIGGTIVYIGEFGDKNKFLDLVIVVAAHVCDAVDALLFDNQRVQIDPGNNRSFTPVEQTISITRIQRYKSLVTVTLNQDIPYLMDGDQVLIQNVHPVAAVLNGKFGVTIVGRAGGGLTFSYLSGGMEIDIPTYGGSETGQVTTLWPDYGKQVHMEVMLGTQTLGQTFSGMIYGTVDADGNTVTPSTNPWTADCSLIGKTAVHLRLQYSSAVFAAGIPQISFQIRGKSDILDPRTSPPTRGYSENAALCIADYLADGTWGFDANWGTEIDTANVIAAANLCDEAVSLAAPLGTTEPRYALNGHFPLTMRRSEILQNMLTAMAGRLTYQGGQFGIHPAAWRGLDLALSNSWMLNNASGSIRWRPTVSISNLFNGVKGTFISPSNGWTAADFPRYAQDADHGYNDGPPEYQYDANLAADGGDRRWKDIQLPFTISHATAQRLAKIELMRSRQQGTGTFSLNMAGYRISTLDILSVTLDYFGWSGKYLEVLASRFKLDRQNEQGSEVVLLGTEIDIQETDPSVYDWELIEELSPQGYQNPGVPNGVFTPDPPSNLHFSFDDNGRTILLWTAPVDGYVTHGGRIQARYRHVTSPSSLWVSLGDLDPSVTQLTIPLLMAGELYVVELRSENAAGIPSDWVSINYTPLPIPPQWAPYQVRADAADALFPGEWTFDVNVAYADRLGGQQSLADGTAAARTNVTGVLPITQLLACDAPVIYAAAVGAAGGHLRGGQTLYVSVTADDGAGNYTPPAAIVQVDVPAGTDTNYIALNVGWPNSQAGLAHYDIYASPLIDLVCAQSSGALTNGPSSPPTSPASDTYTPLIVFLGEASSPPGALSRQTWALPNPNLKAIRLRGVICYHAGVLGAGVTSVSGNQVISTDCVSVFSPPVGTPVDWTGRKLIVLGRNNPGAFPFENIPFASFAITAFNPATGAFTLDRSADGILQPGDAFAVSTRGYDNSSDPYRLQDSGWKNSNNYDFQTNVSTPYSGITADERQMVARIIAGTNRGASANVVSNTTDTHILDSPLQIAADSAWIITEAGWPYQIDSAVSGSGVTTISLPVGNFGGITLFLAPVLVNLSGEAAIEGDGPTRFAYLYGSQGTRYIYADAAMLQTDSLVKADATLGPIVYTSLPFAQIPNRTFTVAKTDSSDHAVTIKLQYGDTFDDETSEIALVRQGDSTLFRVQG